MKKLDVAPSFKTIYICIDTVTPGVAETLSCLMNVYDLSGVQVKIYSFHPSVAEKHNKIIKNNIEFNNNVVKKLDTIVNAASSILLSTINEPDEFLIIIATDGKITNFFNTMDANNKYNIIIIGGAQIKIPKSDHFNKYYGIHIDYEDGPQFKKRVYDFIKLTLGDRIFDGNKIIYDYKFDYGDFIDYDDIDPDVVRELIKGHVVVHSHRDKNYAFVPKFGNLGSFCVQLETKEKCKCLVATYVSVNIMVNYYTLINFSDYFFTGYENEIHVGDKKFKAMQIFYSLVPQYKNFPM